MKSWSLDFGLHLVRVMTFTIITILPRKQMLMFFAVQILIAKL